MANECNCGFDIPTGGTLGELHLTTPLDVASGGTGGLALTSASGKIGIGKFLIQWGTKSLNLSNIASGAYVTSSEILFSETYKTEPIVLLTCYEDSAGTNYGGYFTFTSRSIQTGRFYICATNVTTITSSSIGNRDVNWVAIGEVN